MNRSSALRMRIAIAGVQATMQQTVARKMRYQKFHLVSQDPSAREINVLGVCWHKRHRQKLHSGFFGRATPLVVIASFACSDDILPNVPATFAEGFYVVARQIRISELIPAIKAQIGIAPKQGTVVQWRSITRQALKIRTGLAGGADNGVDREGTLLSRPRVYPAVHVIKHRTHWVKNLIKTVKPNGFFKADPLNRHPGYVGSQHPKTGVDHCSSGLD